MVFELGGFANLTDEFSANLTVKYGSGRRLLVIIVLLRILMRQRVL